MGVEYQAIFSILAILAVTNILNSSTFCLSHSSKLASLNHESSSLPQQQQQQQQSETQQQLMEVQQQLQETEQQLRETRQQLEAQQHLQELNANSSHQQLLEVQQQLLETQQQLEAQQQLEQLASNGTLQRESLATDIVNDQKFVVSLKKENMDVFHERNRESLLPSLEGNNTHNNASFVWFPAFNGHQQSVLNDFSAVTGFPPLNASDFDPSIRDLPGLSTPHHVGCFMSHWHLMRLALSSWDTLPNLPRPKALWIMEDDAYCSKNTYDEVQEIMPQLPKDWDLFFFGGKPFTYYHNQPVHPNISSRWNFLSNYTKAEWKDFACKGYFGHSKTGPFAPDGSRNLSFSQPYWETKYILNTHAYIVNPNRIERVLDILEHSVVGFQTPVDVAYAFAGERDKLKIFMSTKEHCKQVGIGGNVPDHPPMEPSLWHGYYSHPQIQGFRWGDMLFPECPDKL